jgi:hypothetical protein
MTSKLEAPRIGLVGVAALTSILGAVSVCGAQTIEDPLRWDPPLMHAGVTTTLQHCARARCRTLVTIDPGTLVTLARSPSGRYAALWVTAGERGSLIHVFDLRRQRAARFDLLEVRRGTLSWSSAEHILVRSSSAMGNAEVQMFSVQGRALLSTGGSTVETSPDGAYLATYPGRDDMPALRPAFFLYRLIDGRPVRIPELPAGWDRVQAVEWSRTDVVVTTLDEGGRATTTRIPLRR